MNGNPVVGGSPSEARVFKELYAAQAHQMVAAASGGQQAGSQDYSESDKNNDLPMQALSDVVGFRNRAITDVNLDLWGGDPT